LSDKHHMSARKREDSQNRFVYRDGLRFEQTLDGLVFCPEYDEGLRKHKCPDCMSCGWCSDSRCAACLREAPGECKADGRSGRGGG